MLIVVAFLLHVATQINHATNKRITAQNYCPPCQLGKLPSSRISTDILALHAQNLQQLGASLDQATVQNTLFLAYNKPTVHKIPQAHNQYSSVQKIATHSRYRGAELSAHHRIQ